MHLKEEVKPPTQKHKHLKRTHQKWGTKVVLNVYNSIRARFDRARTSVLLMTEKSSVQWRAIKRDNISPEFCRMCEDKEELDTVNLC